MILKISLLYFCSTVLLFSQEKREYETRIEAEEFPVQAINLIAKTQNEMLRLKFYKEQDGTNVSYEAKFKYNGHKYSMEFSADGVFEDIETEVTKAELKKPLFSKIETYLNTHFQRWKIEKIQAQYTKNGDPNAVLKRALNQEISENVNYEVVVATKSKNKLQKFEFLFNGEGKKLNQRKIIRRSYDFLIF